MTPAPRRGNAATARRGREAWTPLRGLQPDERRLVGGEIGVAEEHEAHFGDRVALATQELAHGVERELCCALDWEAIGARRYRGKRNRRDPSLGGDPQARPIGGGEQTLLSSLTAVPNRPDRVDHELRPKLAAGCDHGI